jgi:hypothetical protein
MNIDTDAENRQTWAELNNVECTRYRLSNLLSQLPGSVRGERHIEIVDEQGEPLVRAEIKYSNGWSCRHNPKCPRAIVVKVIQTNPDRLRQGHATAFLTELSRGFCVRLESLITAESIALAGMLQMRHGWIADGYYGGSARGPAVITPVDQHLFSMV